MTAHLELNITGELPAHLGHALEEICALDGVDWTYRKNPDPIVQTFVVTVEHPVGCDVRVTEDSLRVVLERRWLMTPEHAWTVTEAAS